MISLPAGAAAPSWLSSHLGLFHTRSTFIISENGKGEEEPIAETEWERVAIRLQGPFTFSLFYTYP